MSVAGVREQRALIVNLALLGLFAIFGRYVLSAGAAASPGFDDAFFAVVAKNVASGVGYASSYHEVKGYDEEISTGPTVILPAALLARTFGNQLWVPGVAAALQGLLWLAVLLLVTARTPSMTPAPTLALALLVALMVLARPGFSAAYGYWFELYGEIPAALMVATGAILLLGRERDSSRTTGGLVLGLAVVTKLLAALAVGTIATVFLILERRRVSRRPMWRPIAALALPFVLWRVHVWRALGDRYEAFRQSEQGLFLRIGSGVWQLATAPDLPGALAANAARNAQAAAGALGGAVPGAALGLLVASAVIASSPRAAGGEPEPSARVSLALGAASLVHFFWWLVMSPFGWPRHVLLAHILGLCAAVFGLTAIRAGVTRRLLVTLAIGLVVAALPEALRLVEPVPPDPRRVALVETAHFLEKLRRDPQVVLLGAGWWQNPDLEYTLAGHRSFLDADGLTPETLARPLYLVRSEYWNWERSHHLERLAAVCDREIVYRKPPFLVSRCARQAWD